MTSRLRQWVERALRRLTFKCDLAPLDRRDLAVAGEDAAAGLLIAKGYRILARNYRTSSGELDIIARQADELVFVEVKSRTSEEFGSPAYSVSKAKQRKLASLARGYVAQKIRKEVAWRFDIVEVLLSEAGKVREINLIPGAFRPEK
jgi:putative endonuclease